jgi:hypothetical protein
MGDIPNLYFERRIIMEEMMNNVVEEAVEETVVPTVIEKVTPTVAASEIPQVATKAKSSKMKLIALGIGIAGIVFRKPIENAVKFIFGGAKEAKRKETREVVKMTIDELEKTRGEAKSVDAEVVHDPNEESDKDK